MDFAWHLKFFLFSEPVHFAVSSTIRDVMDLCKSLFQTNPHTYNIDKLTMS